MWTPLVIFVFTAATVAQEMHPLDVKQCPDEPDATDYIVKSAEVSDLIPGKNFHTKTTVVVKKELSENVRLKVTQKTAAGALLPCYYELGSCEYKLCGGTTPMQKIIGEAWGNKCPIKPKEYTSTSTVMLPWIVRLGVGDGNIHTRAEVRDGSRIIGCVEYDTQIKL